MYSGTVLKCFSKQRKMLTNYFSFGSKEKVFIQLDTILVENVSALLQEKDVDQGRVVQSPIKLTQG